MYEISKKDVSYAVTSKLSFRNKDEGVVKMSRKQMLPLHCIVLRYDVSSIFQITLVIVDLKYTPKPIQAYGIG